MLNQHLNNVLLIEPRLWIQTLEALRLAKDEGIKVQAYRPRQAMPNNDVDEINITGVLLKSVPDEVREFGIDATGYDDIAASITAAASSNRRAIVLHVNSGGGMVDGIDVALEAIRAAKAVKPIVAYVDGMAASAAYWLASQANTLYATRFSEVGSIGAYSVMYDTEGMADKRGVKVVVSRSGNQKGAGIFGDPITDEMKAAQDDAIKSIAYMFMSDVIAARGDINPDEVSSGRSWLAEQAKELGLIDGVVRSSREITIPVILDTPHVAVDKVEAMAKDTPEPETTGDMEMSENTIDVVTVERERVTAIMGAFASDPTFARKHIEAGSTLEQAKAEHYDVVMARQAALASIADTTPAPVASCEPVIEDAPENALAQARSLALEKGIPLHEAMAMVANTNRDAFVAYATAGRG